MPSAPARSMPTTPWPRYSAATATVSATPARTIAGFGASGRTIFPDHATHDIPKILKGCLHQPMNTRAGI